MTDASNKNSTQKKVVTLGKKTVASENAALSTLEEFLNAACEFIQTDAGQTGEPTTDKPVTKVTSLESLVSHKGSLSILQEETEVEIDNIAQFPSTLKQKK